MKIVDRQRDDDDDDEETRRAEESIADDDCAGSGNGGSGGGGGDFGSVFFLSLVLLVDGVDPIESVGKTGACISTEPHFKKSGRSGGQG